MVAMFAALMFVMSQGTRTGQAELSSGQSELAAAEIIEYMNQVANTMKTLEISGCDPLEIDFSSGVYKNDVGTELNAAPAGAKPECGMFNPAGGGINAVTFEKYTDPNQILVSGAMSGHLGFRYKQATYNGDHIGTNASDLFLHMRGMQTKVCLAVMNKLRTSSTAVTSLTTITSTNASGNTWTMGTPGSLTPLAMPIPGRILAYLHPSDPTTGCAIGMLIKVN